jgi:N-acetylmuramoyl-L-alanine amidase
MILNLLLFKNSSKLICMIGLIKLISIGSFASQPLKIIIDPGHGGADHGAVFYNIREADINLKVANLLKKLIDQNISLHSVLTRNSDENLTLEDRSHFASKQNGDVFISLHSNSFNNSKTHGVEFYFQNQLPPNEEAMYLANKENNSLDFTKNSLWPLKPIAGYEYIKSEVVNILQDLQLNQRIHLSSQLAEKLNNQWIGLKRSTQHSIKQAPFHVISSVNMPSTLIELGYLSNPTEAKFLNSKSYQEKMANSIYQGLLKYKEFIDKSISNNLN